MDASGLEERIGTLLAQHREELAQLVDQALTRELETLVAERVAARNGHEVEHAPHGPTTDDARTARATKTCAGPCARTLPLTAFEPHRAKCRECRRADLARTRERRAAAAAEEPPRTDLGPAADPPGT